MIDPEQVEHRGVQIVNVNLTLDDLEAHVVGFAIGEAWLYASACHPGTEALRLMFATMLVDRMPYRSSPDSMAYARIRLTKERGYLQAIPRCLKSLTSAATG
jgi:hypothetical protein